MTAEESREFVLADAEFALREEAEVIEGSLIKFLAAASPHSAEPPPAEALL